MVYEDLEKDYVCGGCGEQLSDCGPVGYSCLNKDCNYELEQALKWMKKQKEREELAELARLKEKYENS